LKQSWYTVRHSAIFSRMRSMHTPVFHCSALGCVYLIVGQSSKAAICSTRGYVLQSSFVYKFYQFNAEPLMISYMLELPSDFEWWFTPFCGLFVISYRFWMTIILPLSEAYLWSIIIVNYNFFEQPCFSLSYWGSLTHFNLSWGRLL
jgi:hypothetical protein